jgi:hypothetical protein
MHCVLEGLAHNRCCVILGLMSISAACKPVQQRAFQHQFTKVDLEDVHLPDDMSTNEVKSLAGIHELLMAPLAGVGDVGSVLD